MESFAAQDLSQRAIGKLHIRGRYFVDNHGRTLSLRGVNISGSSKLPKKPNGLSHLSDGFFDHNEVSFIGRPFPLAEAPEHFARLRDWGLPVIRLLVTWEALSHDGADQLDHEYIQYLHDLIALMPQYGLKCFICAHQDVFSRFSGGSGAPGWTFEAAGLDIRAFKATGAAYVHNVESEQTCGYVNPKEPSGPFVWPSGYQKLAAASMATLFWAGRTFAWKLTCPSITSDGSPKEINIQDYLQSSYLNAFGQLADVVGGLEACLGFEVMNEPHRGYCNLHSFHQWNYQTDLHVGHYPSFLQSLALGSGYAQSVPYYVKSWPFPTRISHQSTIDPKGRSVWLTHDETEDHSTSLPLFGLGECVWRAHGVWEWDREKKAPVALRNDYFRCDPRPSHLREPGMEGRDLEWYRDFYAPFISQFSHRVRRRHQNLVLFVEPIPNEFMPPWPAPEVLQSATEEDRKIFTRAAEEQDYAVQTLIRSERPNNMVYAPHFYDLNVLFGKHHGSMSVDVQGLSRGMFILNALFFGADGLVRNYSRQLGKLRRYAHLSMGELPVLIGEVGIPFDINNATALRDGNYSKQRELMGALITAMETNHLGFTLWNYNPDNTVEYGDGWNKEDFSVVCYNDGAACTDTKIGETWRGGRVLAAIIRPYAAKLAGLPLETSWDPITLEYHVRYMNPAIPLLESDIISDTKKSAVTEIFLPRYHYEGKDVAVVVRDGHYQLDEELQTLYVIHDRLEPRFEHDIRILVRGATLSERSALQRLGIYFTLSDWLRIGAVFAVGACLVAWMVRYMQQHANL